MKNILYSIIFVSIAFIMGCNNGVYFAPSILDDGVINTEVPEIKDPEPEEGTGVQGVGTNSFTFDFLPSQEITTPNLKYIPLDSIYASIIDTTGEGFATVQFTLSMDIPLLNELLPPKEENVGAYSEGDQNIVARILDAEVIEGTEDGYLKTSFAGGSKTFEFTPDSGSAIIEITYNETTLAQRRSIPIVFEFLSTVYNAEMPLRMVLFSYSKGVSDPQKVVMTSFREKSDKVDLYSPTPDKPTEWNLKIKNDDLRNAVTNDYAVDMAMTFGGVVKDYPLTVTTTEGSNVSIQNITNTGVSADGYMDFSFTLTHKNVAVPGEENGKATLTVSSKNNEVYAGLPFTIDLNSLRDYEKSTVTVSDFSENNNADAVHIESTSATSRKINISDTSKTSAEQETYEIPIKAILNGYVDAFPITVVAKDAKNLTATEISVSGGSATLKATHSGVNIFEKTNGSVTLTIDSPHKNVYSALPIDVVVTSERAKTFKNYVNEYFTTTQHTANLKDSIGYYTQIAFKKFEGVSDDVKLSFELKRLDDRKTAQSIETGIINANAGFVEKDYNALMIRNVTRYELKITHEDTTFTVTKEGSRKQTNYEQAISAMDAVRHGVWETHNHKDKTISAGGGTFRHWRSYKSWEVAYHHDYNMSNFKPFFASVSGSYSYGADGGSNNTIDTRYGTWAYYRVPYKGTISFASPYGSGKMTLNSVHINNNNKNDPGWDDGSITVTADGKTVTYDKHSVLPFGFYMDYEDSFRGKVAPGDSYTQR